MQVAKKGSEDEQVMNSVHAVGRVILPECWHQSYPANVDPNVDCMVYSLAISTPSQRHSPPCPYPRPSPSSDVGPHSSLCSSPWTGPWHQSYFTGGGAEIPTAPMLWIRVSPWTPESEAAAPGLVSCNSWLSVKHLGCTLPWLQPLFTHKHMA